MLEKLLRPFLNWRRLDLRSAKSRLAPIRARHVEISALFSLDDDPATPNERLLQTALSSIRRAQEIYLPGLLQRGAPGLASTWPGEHYRLLAALVDVLQPQTVVEVGTYQGLSALAMLERLPEGAVLTTFDVLPWGQIEGSYLRQEDLVSGQLVPIAADLSQPTIAVEYAGLLRQADLIFLDAAKDGSLEQRLLDNFDALGLQEGALVVLDDIRLWNMLHIWRSIRRPKLDLTSFGHWSGTGLVDWRLPKP